MENEINIIDLDSTPHASPGNGEADQAGSCLLRTPAFLDYEQLWQKMAAKGMGPGSFSEEQIVHCLRTYGYYRLRGFWITLEEQQSFKPGTTFDDVLDIHNFDAALASLILDLIKPVELALRSAISYELARSLGPFAFESTRLLASKSPQRRFDSIFARELSLAISRKTPFVMHNLEEYGRLPVWAAVELSSFGTMSNLYRNLASGEVKKEIAAYFGLKPKYMESWLRYLTQIRNMCAHHDRIYNLMLPMRPALHSDCSSIDTMRLFPVFMILFRLGDHIHPERKHVGRLRLASLIEAYPGLDLAPVGFPANWREILDIPRQGVEGPRPRGRQGGRPAKSTQAVQQALFLYDQKQGSIQEICRKTGLSSTTLYKYIHLRECE